VAVKNPLCNYSGEVKELQSGDTLPGGGGSTSVTTKGDIQGYDTAANRIPVGTNGQGLVADSSQALGLKWANQATIFSVTALDANNSASKVHVLSITVPANTWADGETIYFSYVTDTKQNSGGAMNLTAGLTWNGNSQNMTAASVANSGTEGFAFREVAVTRVGTTLYSTMGNPSGGGVTTTYNGASNMSINHFTGTSGVTLTSQSFSADATLSIDITWASANSLTFYKILGAQAYKV
jgi:hypothetical protein